MGNPLTRRSFIQVALLGAAAVPLLAQAGSSCPAAAPAGKATAKVGEGMAKALEYTEDATTAKNPKYKAGNDCGNCKLYLTAKEEGKYAPCSMLGMKYVPSCGWCKGYSAKA